MKKALLVIISVILLIPSTSEAQRWKRQRYEFSFGAGISNFLGELGGANQIGTHYFRDIEWSMTRLALSVGLRYKLSNYFALKSHLSYGRVAGDDKLTTEFFRNYRNLDFYSDIYEFNINFEGAFQQEQVGHRYRLRKVKGMKGYEIYTYAFVGAGVFYFDPKSNYQGTVVRLQPLGTEGQGFIATRTKYSLIQLCVPVGIGFKYTLDRSWGVGLELGIRKTFTDYMDDVSGKYYDNDAIRAAKGDKAAYLADPSKGNVKGASEPNADGSGAQRGNPKYKDAYMFFTINACYKFTKKKRTRSKF